MVWTLVFALLLQDVGPRNLQVADSTKVKAPLVVPVGTTIPIALVNSISTKTAKDGDGVYARTTFPITVNNEIAIPVGTSIKGRVTGSPTSGTRQRESRVDDLVPADHLPQRQHPAPLCHPRQRRRSRRA